QVFADERWKDVVARAVGRYLDGRLGPDPDRGPDAAAVSFAVDPAHWGVTAEGLRITAMGSDFGLGERSGDLEIVVPWADFGKSLRADFAAALRE
ncbi:MAG TPA: hypothetical protein VIP05_30490, partial [Burkholderiaceae bacterium]